MWSHYHERLRLIDIQEVAQGLKLFKQPGHRLFMKVNARADGQLLSPFPPASSLRPAVEFFSFLSMESPTVPPARSDSVPEDRNQYGEESRICAKSQLRRSRRRGRCIMTVEDECTWFSHASGCISNKKVVGGHIVRQNVVCIDRPGSSRDFT